MATQLSGEHLHLRARREGGGGQRHGRLRLRRHRGRHHSRGGTSRSADARRPTNGGWKIFGFALKPGPESGGRVMRQATSRSSRPLAVGVGLSARAELHNRADAVQPGAGRGVDRGRLRGRRRRGRAGPRLGLADGDPGGQCRCHRADRVELRDRPGGRRRDPEGHRGRVRRRAHAKINAGLPRRWSTAHGRQGRAAHRRPAAVRRHHWLRGLPGARGHRRRAHGSTSDFAFEDPELRPRRHAGRPTR